VKLSLQLPYSIEQKEDGTYFFKTISGISYIAYFIDVSFDSTIPLYSFSFEPENEKGVYDERISVTIIHILRKFFENHLNSMLFVCDVSDGKEKGRLRLFNNWYKNYQGDDILLKIDYQTTFPDYNLLASLLIHKENVLKDFAIKQFQEFIEAMKY
jgi:hypothetical protein